MKNFAYDRSSSVEDAVKSFAPASEYLAGGTELLNWMRLGIVGPERVIDIGGLTGHREIRREQEHLVVGSLATLNEIGGHPLVEQHATVLGQACLQAASPQIRNRATIGGNVLQKTRCPYFRAEAPLPWACNKREPGSGCSALKGSNERHAILGWTDSCIAVHPSDPLVALACLDAEAHVVGPAGRRTISMRSFHLSQEEARKETGRKATLHEAQLESRLRAGEIIVAYHIPVAHAERSAYVKVRERSSYEYALVSAAATLLISEGKIERARIALGSVAQRPWRLELAERALVGKPATKESVLPTIVEALKDARPLEHNGYKVVMAANAAARAIVQAGASV